MDFVRRWSEKTEIGVGRFIEWLGVTASKFYGWRQRYGKVNEHNGWIPRDFWLEEWEKQAIRNFHLKNPLEGYRRLTFMMLDQNIVAVSPSSVWRVLGQAGLLSKWNGKPSKKGTGFAQPLAAHQHWHIDVSYLNIGGTFYYLCSVLDDHSRFITSPFYPQSNRKIERWHKSLKGECIRPGTPLTLDDARRMVQGYVDHYNNVRLNSATGYITPKDMLAGRQQDILAERDRKLEATRKQRQIRRKQAAWRIDHALLGVGGEGSTSG